MADPCVPPSYGAIPAATPSEVDALLPGGGSAADTAATTSAATDGSHTGFDTKQTYYLQSNTTWTRRKIFATAVPILAACLIMGGIAFFLFRDFGHLYPGRGGDRSPFYSNGGMSSGGGATDSSSSMDKDLDDTASSKTSTSSSATDDMLVASKPSRPFRQRSKHTSGGASSSSSSTDTSSDGASCAVHPDCSKLIGNCCPTNDGHTLVCCNL